MPGAPSSVLVKEVESEDSSTSIDSSSRSVLFRWPIPLIIAMRFASGFATFAMYEAVPLWLIADKEVGGLAMTEKSVGSLLCRSGIWNIVYFMWILPKCSKMLGTRAFSILTSGIAAVTAVLLPFSTSVAMANVLHLICASALVSQNALNLAFTNNAAGPEHRVVANGFAVTSETVGKAIGPVAFSSLFAWSLQTWGWGGHAMVFCILAALSLMQITCVLLLPSYVGTGQKEAQELPSENSAGEGKVGEVEV